MCWYTDTVLHLMADTSWLDVHPSVRFLNGLFSKFPQSSVLTFSGTFSLCFSEIDDCVNEPCDHCYRVDIDPDSWLQSCGTEVKWADSCSSYPISSTIEKAAYSRLVWPDVVHAWRSSECVANRAYCYVCSRQWTSLSDMLANRLANPSRWSCGVLF